MSNSFGIISHENLLYKNKQYFIWEENHKVWQLAPVSSVIQIDIPNLFIIVWQCTWAAAVHARGRANSWSAQRAQQVFIMTSARWTGCARWLLLRYGRARRARVESILHSSGISVSNFISTSVVVFFVPQNLSGRLSCVWQLFGLSKQSVISCLCPLRGHSDIPGIKSQILTLSVSLCFYTDTSLS